VADAVRWAVEGGGANAMLADSGGGGGASGGGSFALPEQCSFFALLLYLLLPPLACVLPPLAGLVALALQSPRAMRLYAIWNGASLWCTSVALAVIIAYLQLLGWDALFIPFGLLAAKLLSAQLVPIELAVLESARPIRGWRGLYEVRTGPIERMQRAGVK
jgi:hypothetical protein